METTIRNQLRQFAIKQGKIKLDSFINDVATYYYSNKDPFGIEGDFITSPEISQLFGEVIAAYIVDSWQQMGEVPFNLIEFGPGRGTLMYDILRLLTKIPGFADNLTNIYLLETSPLLANKQKEKLKEYKNKVIWLDSISKIPKGPNIVIANEFLDALPIRQYKKKCGNWYEVEIKYNENDDLFYFTESEFIADESSKLNSYYPRAQEGALLEISDIAINIIKEVASSIKSYGGRAIFIDYGYDVNPDARIGFSSSVQAVHKHKYCDVFENIGNADITAHVDFNSLKANIEIDTQVITQREFLKRNSIDYRLTKLLSHANEQQKENLILGYNRLTDIGQMGELFKVLELKPIR